MYIIYIYIYIYSWDVSETNLPHRGHLWHNYNTDLLISFAAQVKHLDKVLVLQPDSTDNWLMKFYKKKWKVWHLNFIKKNLIY